MKWRKFEYWNFFWLDAFSVIFIFIIIILIIFCDNFVWNFRKKLFVKILNRMRNLIFCSLLFFFEFQFKFKFYKARVNLKPLKKWEIDFFSNSNPSLSFIRQKLIFNPWKNDFLINNLYLWVAWKSNIIMMKFRVIKCFEAVICEF